MASSISTTSIDATFPVAGQDNDSQGFRDNFSQLKTQLDTASSEITTIQTNQAVTNATTNFNGHDIQNAILIDVGQKIVAKGTVSGSQTIDFSAGPVQTVTTSGALTLAFTNFPVEDNGSTNAYGKVKLIITNASSHSITLTGVTMPFLRNPDAMSQANDSTVGVDYSTRVAIPAETGIMVIEVWSVNGGTNKYASYPVFY